MQHPSEILQEELDERGWTLDVLALRMIRDDRDDFGITRLALDLYWLVGPSEPSMIIDDVTASQLSHALGVSAEFLKNLCSSWRAWALEHRDELPKIEEDSAP